MSDYIAALLSGFFTAAGLIMAIGAQNAFVLSLGLQGRYCTSIALTCAGLDAVLIIAGVAGMGLLIKTNPDLLFWVTLAGALFLTGYGLKSLFSAFHTSGLKARSGTVTTRRGAVLTCLGMSLLNPHVYLDTVILIGSVGATYTAYLKVVFTVGACMASLCWFLSLSHGARYLNAYLASARAWQILDVLIAGMMFTIAASLWSALLD